MRKHDRRTLYSRRTDPARFPEDENRTAYLHLTLMKRMAGGAAAGFLAGLIVLAIAEGVGGCAVSGFLSGLVLFSFAGWTGAAVYIIGLLRALFS